MTSVDSLNDSKGPEDFEKCPIVALRLNTIAKISNSLNPIKVLPSDEGLPRDWRGLAQLSGIDGETVFTLGSNSDPTAEIFKLLTKSFNSNSSISLGMLKTYLSQIDRWDIVDDTSQMFEEDARNFLSRQEDVETSRSVGNLSADKDILTVGDVSRIEKGLNPQRYDAFLLYAEEDNDFAMEIVDKMEKEYKLKLCIKDRDLIGGLTFEHDAIMKLIAERCNRLVVVVSPNFLRSEANKFFVTFAQALGIDQRQRKVLPCLYQRCQLPPELSYYFLLDYNRAGKFWNFWEKLRDSIQVPDTTISRLQTDENIMSLQDGSMHLNSMNGEWITEPTSLITYREPPPPYTPSDVLHDFSLKNRPYTPKHGSTNQLKSEKPFSKEISHNISRSISESNVAALGTQVVDAQGDNSVSISLQSEDIKYKVRPKHWLRRLLPKEKKTKDKKCRRKAVEV